MAIQRLPSVDVVSLSDQVPLGSSAAGIDVKAPLSQIKDAILDGFAPEGGILSMSGFYSMRVSTPVNVSVGTAYANIPNYDATPLVFPSGRNSIAPMTVLGEFVAQRDIAGAMFWVALTGTWPTTRDLTLAVLVGADASPFESSFQFVGAGRGGAAPVTAAFSGPTVNLNHPGGVIQEGEKIRLVAKMSVADTLALTKLAFVVQTLDGI